MRVAHYKAEVTARRPGRPRDEQATLAIRQAALRQLEEIGYADISMESIAVEAGVSRATIYRRFKDKTDVITAAIAANISIADSEQPSSNPRADLIDYLEQFDKRFGDGCVEVIGALLGSHEERAGLALHRERIIEPRLAYARNLLRRAQELGELAVDLDVDLAVQMLAGSVFARRVHGRPSPRDWAQRAVDMIWREPADLNRRVAENRAPSG